MQPSMGILNSPSSRVVKDSTPSRGRILRCANFGIGESSPNLFLNMISPSKMWSTVNLEWTGVLLFYYFVYLKVNLDLKNQIRLVNLHPTLFSRQWILNQLLKKKCELMVNLDLTILLKRWTGVKMRWVGSRCPLTHALNFISNIM